LDRLAAPNGADMDFPDVLSRLALALGVGLLIGLERGWRTREAEAGSRAAGIYDAARIRERHRHRYEVNINYKERLEQVGLRFSGMSPDGVLPEMVELPEHPWFIGVQFHPELKSKPFEPHPLFTSFIEAAIRQSRLV